MSRYTPYMRRASASDPERQMSRRALVSTCTLLAGGKAALAAPASPALLEAAADEKDVGISDEVQHRFTYPAALDSALLHEWGTARMHAQPREHSLGQRAFARRS